jgi:hypothetical protein
MVEAGGVGINTAVENTDVIDFSRLQNAEHDKIAPNWNVFGTRVVSLLPRNEVGLWSDTRGRPKRSNLAVGFSLEASWVRGTGSDYGRLAGSTRNWRFPSIRYVAKSA